MKALYDWTHVQPQILADLNHVLSFLFIVSMEISNVPEHGSRWGMDKNDKGIVLVVLNHDLLKSSLAILCYNELYCSIVGGVVSEITVKQSMIGILKATIFQGYWDALWDSIWYDIMPSFGWSISGKCMFFLRNEIEKKGWDWTGCITKMVQIGNW